MVILLDTQAFLRFLIHQLLTLINGFRRDVMAELVKQHLNRATARMKSQADKGRFERQF
jgi:hypothetical protein